MKKIILNKFILFVICQICLTVLVKAQEINDNVFMLPVLPIIEEKEDIYTKDVNVNNVIIINDKKPIIQTEELKQVILFKVVDDNGNEMEYVPLEDRKIIEKNIEEFEKNKKINNRDGKVYIINMKKEVVTLNDLKK